MIRTLAILAALFAAAGARAGTLTAARLIRPATVIGTGDVRIVADAVPGALTGDTDVVGMEARVTLYPGTPIRAIDIGPAALVERNQPVKLLFRAGRISITADGRALSRGAEGEPVRVMNLSSRQTVTGTVAADGTVHVTTAGAMR